MLIGIALLTGGIIGGAITRRPTVVVGAGLLGLVDILVAAKLWIMQTSNTQRASRRSVLVIGLIFTGAGVAGVGWAVLGHVHVILLVASICALLGGVLSLWVAIRFDHIQTK